MTILVIMFTVNGNPNNNLRTHSLQSSSRASDRILSFIKSTSLWVSGTVLWCHAYNGQEMDGPAPHRWYFLTQHQREGLTPNFILGRTVSSCQIWGHIVTDRSMSVMPLNTVLCSFFSVLILKVLFHMSNHLIIIVSTDICDTLLSLTWKPNWIHCP